MADNQQGRERDLVLAPGQYAFILDETKGILAVYVGPNKTSLANTDRPVRYNAERRRFDRVNNLDDAISECPLATEGSYIVLHNPAASEDSKHPQPGSSTQTKLLSGSKVCIPGPTTFPLWPGQVAHVIEGHRLQSNQYLIARVYNETEAARNRDKMVMRPADASAAATTPAQQDLTIGKLLVIRGNEVSFFIPPTGIEVLPDEDGEYTREAVTLERLEYCILLDENGSKSVVTGPEVVFPSPTESFVEHDGARKFKAIDLNKDSGIYVKVIADYLDDATGLHHKIGDELFITGEDQRIYYPRDEHAIIRYGDADRHYGIIIPEGEARYVLDKDQGKVVLKRGPQILLPDPRTEVVVRRVLEEREVLLMYPGNQEALGYNRRLRELLRGSPEQTAERALKDSEVRRAIRGSAGAVSHRMGMMEGTKGAAGVTASYSNAMALSPDVGMIGSNVGDMSSMGEYASLGAAPVGAAAVGAGEFDRATKYTPPRTLTLDTKYDGAVSVGVWPGYAVLVINKRGEKRVVQGPATVLLEYDETLQPLRLSTGKPKNMDAPYATVYLQVEHNHVSDIVDVITRDHVAVKVKLSFRVSFTGDPNKWFAVDNYVKLLCDRVRSRLKHAVKEKGIEEFIDNSTPIIRDTVLGQAADGAKRSGLIFQENGMHVYDVDVLGLDIGDAKIASMLATAQHDSVGRALEVAQAQRALDATKRHEIIKRESAQAVAETAAHKAALDLQAIELDGRNRAARDLLNVQTQAAILAQEATRNRHEHEQALLQLETSRADGLFHSEMDQRALEQRLTELAAEAQAIETKVKAVSPDLIAAMQSFGDKALAAQAAQSMAPLAILGGKSVVEVLAGLLDGTGLGAAVKGTIARAANGNGNGTTQALPAKTV